jgi:hypothetical protein
MTLDAERPRHVARRLELAGVPLSVVHGQRLKRVAVSLHDRSGSVGVESAAQEDYRSHRVIE